MIQNIKLWPYFNDIINPKINQNDLNPKVIILKHPMYAGCFSKIVKGKVKNQDQIKIKLTSTNMIEIPVKTKVIEKFFTQIKEICKSLGIELQTVLIILDSLKVHLDPTADLFDKFGAWIDIGLNLISKKNFTLVPELIICKKENGLVPTNDYFENLGLSEEVVELIKSYQTNFPNVIATINNNPKNVYNAKDFKNLEEKDSKIEIIKIYVWLFGQKLNSFTQVAMNSKATTHFFKNFCVLI